MSYTLLTGSTGLIGRYLMRDLLGAGRGVVAFARGEHFKRRILDALSEVPGGLPMANQPERLRSMKADLLEDSLELSSSELDWIAANVSDVIHCAGDVNFQEDGRKHGVWETNVEGSRQLASVVQRLGIDNFSYVSTSFVSGQRSGVVYEHELDCGQEFQSPYERSKFEAEKLLHQQEFRRLNIFRPCSVSGDSASGYSSTFHGIYWFVQFTELARNRGSVATGERWEHAIRIFKDKETTHHLIPVDAVARAIVELHFSSQPGNTFHLTPTEAVTLETMERVLRKYFNYFGVEFIECPGALPELNPMESLFYEGLRAMGHRYLDGDPQFDCTRTKEQLGWWQGVSIDEDYLMRIVDFALKNRFGRGMKRREKNIRKRAIAVG